MLLDLELSTPKVARSFDVCLRSILGQKGIHSVDIALNCHRAKLNPFEATSKVFFGANLSKFANVVREQIQLLDKEL